MISVKSNTLEASENFLRKMLTPYICFTAPSHKEFVFLRTIGMTVNILFDNEQTLEKNKISLLASICSNRIELVNDL